MTFCLHEKDKKTDDARQIWVSQRVTYRVSMDYVARNTIVKDSTPSARDCGITTGSYSNVASLCRKQKATRGRYQQNRCLLEEPLFPVLLYDR